MAIGTKICLAQEGHDLMDCNRLNMQQEEAYCHISMSIYMGRDTDISIMYQHSPKNQSDEYDEVHTWKN